MQIIKHAFFKSICSILIVDATCSDTEIVMEQLIHKCMTGKSKLTFTAVGEESSLHNCTRSRIEPHRQTHISE